MRKREASFAERKVVLTFSLTPKLYPLLRDKAWKEKKSISQLVEEILLEAFDKLENKEEKVNKV